MYTVKNSKSCRGRDGIAYSCTLCRDGKKVAYVSNDGNGGCTHFDWISKAEDELFENHAATKINQCHFSGEASPHTPESLIALMLDEQEEAKKIKRWSRTKTVFILHGRDSFSFMSCPFNETVKNWVMNKYGDQVKQIYDQKGNGILVQKEVSVL